ncbi:MAG: hypothetical protein LPK04_01405 [Caulobacteraceae bacterium]|nr:hypothetical protein [Caulobacteraceae bacterium]
MTALRTLLIAGAFASLATAAAAQPAVVESAPLPAPDLFSAAGRATDLGTELWAEASPQTLKTVIPLLAERPLSPAAQVLARRVLATGARGPDGAGDDPQLAAARIVALSALGDLAAAQAILSRTPGLERSAPLSEAAAEVALLSGNEARACEIGQGLSVDREGIYWLRLRAFCQARAGEMAAAQLTYDLAQSVSRDAVFGRLMAARLAGAAPGAASLRNGLDLAMSRALALDLAGVEAAPTVALALTGEAPLERPDWKIVATEGPVAAATAVLAQGDVDLAQNVRAVLAEPEAEPQPPLTLALLDALIAAAQGRQDRGTLDRLVERGGIGAAADRRRAQDAALIFAALGTPFSAQARGEFAAFPIAQGKTPPARIMAMEAAGRQGLVGETALFALWTAAESGLAGPAAADRARIILALRAAGLEAHARDFAIEGLLALR